MLRKLRRRGISGEKARKFRKFPGFFVLVASEMSGY